MPTDDDRDSTIVDPANEPEPQPQPAQTFSLDDLKTFAREIVAAQQPAPKTEAPRQTFVEAVPEEPTEEEWRDNPKAAGAKELARQLHPLRQQMAFGLDRIAELADTSYAKELPYRETYRAEIDAELGKLDPVLRTRKDTLRLVHDSVAMRHEQDRIESARQEGIRQGRGNAPAPTGVRTDPNAPKVPTPEELGFDDNLIGEINGFGGPDAFARHVSQGRFKDWKDYVAARDRMQNAPKARGSRGMAPVMPFARLEPKKHTLTQ